MQSNQLESFAVDRALQIVDLRLARQHGLSECRIGIEQCAHRSRNLIDDQPAHADGMQAQFAKGAVERFRSVTFDRVGVHHCTLRSAGLSHNGR